MKLTATDSIQIATPQVAKMVSAAWKALSAEQREYWEAMAERDKARYSIELATYSGPLKVPQAYKEKRDPKAPRRYDKRSFFSF